MLSEALLALAAAGGTALVEAVTTDAWLATKSGFLRLLGRGDRSREAVIEQQLERTRAALEAAKPDNEQIRLAQQAAWTARLEDLLSEQPEIADELRALLEQLPTTVSDSAGHVTQHVVAFDRAQQAVQGHGTQIVTFGAQDVHATRNSK